MAVVLYQIELSQTIPHAKNAAMPCSVRSVYQGNILFLQDNNELQNLHCFITE